jgi:hypothetical protein
MISKLIHEETENAPKSSINISELLNSDVLDKYDWIKSKTLDDLMKETETVLNRIDWITPLGIENDQRRKVSDLCKKLVEYRCIDKICDIHRGKHVRWIRLSDPKKQLMNGSIVVDIRFFDSGSYILCKNIYGKMNQLNFDECVIFQKCSKDEQLILMANEYVNK